jgi:peroxiredoxin
MISRLRIGVASWLALTLLLVSPASAAESDNQADRELERWATHLKGAEKFATRVNFAVSVGLPGLSHERKQEYRLVVDRPGAFALRHTGGDAGPTVVSNGKTIVTHAPELNQYTERDPQTLEAYSESVEAMTLLPYGMGHLVMSLLADDPAARLTASSTERKYVGREQIDGIDCVHLRIMEEECDYDVWLTAGPEPKLRRIRPDLTKSLGEEEQQAGFSVTLSLEFSDWDFDPKLEEKTFAFEPPAGAKKVDTFAAQGPEGVLPPIVAAHPLLGEQAPTFELEGLRKEDGLDLEEVSGKQVVVLDFWAIFCPSCIEGLPQLAEVAREFGDKPVVFRAVNIDNSRPAIEKFLKEHKLDLPVLLDPKAKVAESYRVSSIPQTVLIGKDGKVQAVYEGLAKDFKAELTRDISALLEGKDLAAKTLDASADAKPAPATDEEKSQQEGAEQAPDEK